MSFGRRFRIAAGHRELEAYFIDRSAGLAPFFTRRLVGMQRQIFARHGLLRATHFTQLPAVLIDITSSGLRGEQMTIRSSIQTVGGRDAAGCGLA